MSLKNIFKSLYDSDSLIFILMALSVLNMLLNDIETINRPREKCASALNGLIYFLEKNEDAISIIYLWIIKNPANSEAIIVNDSVLKKNRYTKPQIQEQE